MSRCLWTIVLSACCIASIAPSAQSQGQPATRSQAITLEVTIVELTGAQPDAIEKIEKTSEELTRLMNDGKAKIIARLRVRTRTGENFSARVGQRSPIQTAGLPSLQPGEPSRRGDREPARPQAAAVSFPQIQYENSGLSLDGNLMPAGEGMLDVRIKLEMSGLDTSTGKLTPTFTQRSLSDVVRMREGETVIPIGLIQQEPSASTPGQSPTGATNVSRNSFIVLLTAKPIQ